MKSNFHEPIRKPERRGFRFVYTQHMDIFEKDLKIARKKFLKWARSQKKLDGEVIIDRFEIW